jgi:hypothetical protein
VAKSPVAGGRSRGVRALLVPALLAFTALPAVAQDATGVILGRTLDFTNESPVTGAQVELLGERGNRVATVTSGPEGAFRFQDVRPGTYRLSGRSLGYQAVTTPTFDVSEGTATDVILWMGIDAVPLAPLEVVAGRAGVRSLNPLLAAFQERADTRYFRGTYIMAEEISMRSPQRVTDLLATLGSLTVTQETLVNNRTWCAPTIYLDGVRIYRHEPGPGGTGGDAAFIAVNSISPHEIEGMEFYAGGASTPHEFLGPSAGCGVIAIWLKRGG